MKKINIIDAVLVIFIIMLMVIIYSSVYPFKAFRQVHDASPREWITIELVLPQDNEWISKYILKGDKERTLEDKFSGEVIEVYSKELHNKQRVIVRLKVLASKEPGQ